MSCRILSTCSLQGLSKADREMIVVATSGANQCLYCVIAHGAILRVLSKNPLLADQVSVNYRKADLTPRQRAMLDFAMKVRALCSLFAQLLNNECDRIHRCRSSRVLCRRTISLRCAPSASRRMTSGTSLRSAPSSPCRIASPTVCSCALDVLATEATRLQ